MAKKKGRVGARPFLLLVTYIPGLQRFKDQELQHAVLRRQSRRGC